MQVSHVYLKIIERAPIYGLGSICILFLACGMKPDPLPMSQAGATSQDVQNSMPQAGATSQDVQNSMSQAGATSQTNENPVSVETNAGIGGTELNSNSTPCIEAKPDTGENPHPGNYDYASCNSPVCHANWVGGWVYNNPQADYVVQGATVTITNSDNTTLEAVTRRDGFFVLPSDLTMGGIIVPPFKPCISKCPSTQCANTAHSSTDCQSSGCHGRADGHLYIPQEVNIENLPCETLPPMGPRVHDESFDSSCQICHDKSYIGGFVYDGLTSNTAVDRATITLTSTNGSRFEAVSGPGGMFQFENGIISPYVACINKCDVTICSATNSHPNNDDCGTCHDETNRIHVP